MGYRIVQSIYIVCRRAGHYDGPCAVCASMDEAGAEAAARRFQAQYDAARAELQAWLLINGPGYWPALSVEDIRARGACRRTGLKWIDPRIPVAPDWAGRKAALIERLVGTLSDPDAAKDLRNNEGGIEYDVEDVDIDAGSDIAEWTRDDLQSLIPYEPD